MSILLNGLIAEGSAADTAPRRAPAPRPGWWARVRAPGPDNGPIMPIMRSGSESQARWSAAGRRARAMLSGRAGRQMARMGGSAITAEADLTLRLFRSPYEL